MPLALHLLGAFQVTWDGAPLKFATEHTRALLTYLAVEADVAHRRTTLATLLWPEVDELAARHNLRQALFLLKQSLATVPEQDTPLQVTQSTVQWHSRNVVVDLQIFQEQWRLNYGHHHAPDELCATYAERFAQAVALYQGEFLQGLLLKENLLFEEWALLLREQSHGQMLAMLRALAIYHDRQGTYDQMQHYAARQVALEPWHEEGHRQLITALAAQGQSIAALRQYESCRRTLQAELGIAPAPETTALYEQVRRGEFNKRTRREEDKKIGRPGDELRREDAILPSLHPAEVTSRPLPLFLSSTPHNLPAALSPFVGRMNELAEIDSRLGQGVRLLTLVGPGGMGKTRLALEIGRQQLANYPDGVIFVGLAGLTTPTALAGAIVTAISATLGVALQGDDLRAMLGQFLRQRRMLLMLDNFEHLLAGSTEGVELLTALLQAAPWLQILVTSHERLRLRSEQLIQVPPLAVAAGATLAEAADSSAVHLFIQSAQYVQGSFQLTAANLETVLRICQLVQGMPLGLELAAAQVDVLPLRTIADAIARSAGFLTVEWYDLPERQRSLRAVFAWSWRLLTPAEQHILRQISIFQDGFDLTAAAAVTGATQPLLSRLCHKSLLQWQETAIGAGRYTMHELLRQFAAEELHAAGEALEVAARHGCYYLAYLAARGLRLGRGEPKEASTEIQAELDNIRLAWQWAASHSRLAEIEQATYAWWQFFLLHGPDAEAQVSFANAIASVRQQLTATEDNTTGDTTTQLLGQRLLARLLAIHAYYLNSQTPHVAMAAQAREAMALGAASGGFEGESWGAVILGRALFSVGQHQEASAMWQQAIQLVKRYQVDHPQNEWLHDANWEAHNWLAAVLRQLDDYVGSCAAVEQALQICQTLGKRRGELSSLRNLAQLNLFRYDLAAAEKGFVAALALARTLNHRRQEMMVQEGLGQVLRLRGDYMTPLSLWEEAAGAAAEFAAFYDEALIWVALIRLHCQLGDYTAAAQRNERLTYILTQHNIGQEGELYRCLIAASLAQGAGDHLLALQYAEQASQLTENGEMLFRRIDTALSLGHARVAVGEWAGAAVAFQQALEGFQQSGNCALAAEAQAGLALVSLAQGDHAGARALVEAILPLLTTPDGRPAHVGYNSPFFIYWTCYQLLAAHADARAITVLRQGYELLQQQAATLDDTTRQHFLTAVPLNCALVAAYEAWQAKNFSLGK
jgi:predicted ATPase/DNA-binding SARP family transcriptional activator